MATAFPSTLIKPYGMTRRLRVIVNQMLCEDLTIERVLKYAQVFHMWELSWTTLTRTNRTTLDDFLKAVRGQYVGDITFTDPWDSVAYVCRLGADSLPLQEAAYSRWAAKMMLIEVPGTYTPKAAVTAFPTLSTGAVVELPYTMDRRYHTVIKATLDGREKRYDDFADANGLRVWSVGGDVLSDAEALALLNCWEGNYGPYRPMTFTEPEIGTNIAAAHFVETEITHTLVEYNANALRMTVEELR